MLTNNMKLGVSGKYSKSSFILIHWNHYKKLYKVKHDEKVTYTYLTCFAQPKNTSTHSFTNL